MDSSLEAFLKKEGLFLIQRLGRGHSSHIFLASNQKGQKLVIKKERPDSTRFRMAEREAENLEKANSLGIGPKLFKADSKKRIILMEFVEGPTFAEWLFSNPCKKELGLFVNELLNQAKALDKAGLDHGQLAGTGKNILVKGKKPVVIDFEKASLKRKCHNASVLEAFLFKNPHGAIAKKVAEIRNS